MNSPSDNDSHGRPETAPTTYNEGMRTGNRPATVSVVVPMRNEEQYIEACLRSLLAQTFPPEELEVVVVDGRSTDASVEVVRKLQRGWPNLRLLDNPKGIVAVAMNLGIQRARGDFIIRADAHCVYPPSYVSDSVRYLLQTGADNVGGPCATVPADSSFGARLVAAILSNPFGVGNSRFRISMKDGFVDTVPFGAFRRKLFDKIGLYNEKLVRNQDNELNARIRRAGGKIYLASALATQYHPVKSFPELLRKTFVESQWHIPTLCENKHSLGLRHLVPGTFVVFLIISSCLSIFNGWASMVLIGVLAVYFLNAVYFATHAARKYGGILAAAFPFVLLVFHVTYGLGTLMGLRYLLKDPAPKPIRAGE
jgi:glycosyltransferase involved in cell wall biosynthesis